MKAAILTISDKGSSGEREDVGGPLLKRWLAGILKQSLIINLPGSPKGAIENLASVWAAVPHAVNKIRGDTTDCDGIGRHQ